MKRLLALLLLFPLSAFPAAQTTNPGINHPWPLGQLTVTTAGTPVKLTSLITPGNPQCSQLWIKNNSASAVIYVQIGNVAKDTNLTQTLWYLNSGEYVFISATSMGVDWITPSVYYLDSSASGGTALATCIQGGQ